MRKYNKIIAGFAALALGYGALLAAYATTFYPAAISTPTPPVGGVAIQIVAVGIDPLSSELRAEALVFPDATLLNARGYLVKPLEVSLSPQLDRSVMVLPTNVPVSTTAVTLPVTGYIQQWPFDRYGITSLTARTCAVSCVDGAPIATTLSVASQLPGWNVSATSLSGLAVDVSFSRDATVIIFGLLIVAVLILAGVMAVVVAVSAASRTGRLEPQPAFFGWYAALLFATVPLRSFLPGSPPIGSLIDYTVVLWVVLGIGVSMTMYIGTWFRRHPKQ